MYYYSKKSDSKVLHLADCFCIRNTAIDDIGWFESLSKAYNQGCHFCAYCNPLAKQYHKESDESH